MTHLEKEYKYCRSKHWANEIKHLLTKRDKMHRFDGNTIDNIHYGIIESDFAYIAITFSDGTKLQIEAAIGEYEIPVLKLQEFSMKTIEVEDLEYD